MKTAILSDIHSNREALTACLAHARAQGAEYFVCLGDMIGYGADPKAVVQEIAALPGLMAVRGNHDEAVLSGVDWRGTPDGVRQAVEWTRAQLGEHERGFIERLDLMLRADDITYVHASAYEPQHWEYLRHPEQAEECMAAAATPLTFIGHVHVPRIHYTIPSGQIRELSPVDGEPIPLSPVSRYVINVGSVGQPRDGISAACYVIHDGLDRSVTVHRVPYDVSRAARKILRAGLAPRFAERLAQGR